jgi:1,4-dihydroxy-6-naphthoate synthase
MGARDSKRAGVTQARERLVTVGHSPDSDDAFMFYGLASGAVATPGFVYRHVLRDIQTLNEWAREERLDTTAISVHAYAYVAEKYAVLASGASMGEQNYGPLVVARRAVPVSALRGARIAVPGLLTSAYLALQLCVGEVTPVVMPFDTIMDAVAQGRVPYGLLIHEGQLTHAELGLACVLNLGAWWYEETGLPLPLGVNVVRRSLPDDVKMRIARDLRESIAYALRHRAEALTWALQYARGMESQTADTFVGMYVNERTLDMGPDGRAGIEHFLQRAHEAALIPSLPPLDFVG